MCSEKRRYLRQALITSARYSSLTARSPNIFFLEAFLQNFRRGLQINYQVGRGQLLRENGCNNGYRCRVPGR